MSVSTRKYLPQLFVVPEGLSGLGLQEKVDADTTKKDAPKAEENKRTAEAADKKDFVPSYELLLGFAEVIFPEFYVAPRTWALFIRVTDSRIAPPPVEQEDVGRFCGHTLCRFNTLWGHVVEVENGVVCPEYFNMNPFLYSPQALSLKIKNGVTLEDPTIEWQVMRLFSDSNAHATISSNMFQYGRLMAMINALYRHWQYDKYYIEEQRHYQHHVKVLGPWFMPDGQESSYRKDFLPMTLSHPKNIHWGWYNCLRFDYDLTEECPFYMHLNPLSHLLV